MTARTRAARAAAALVLAGAMLVGTAGCTFLTPTATLMQYVPGEGMNLTVGDIAIRNAFALPSEDGHAVSLVLTIVNNSSNGEKVLFQYENDGTKNDRTVVVSGGTSLSFGTTPDQEQLVLLTTDAEEGGLLPVYVQYGEVPGQMLLVPVLDPNAPEYKGLRPPEILR